MNNEERTIDISAKLRQMGQALMKEGGNLNEYTIHQSGNIMVVLSNLILDEKDMYVFSQLVSMFTSKKILESMEAEIKEEEIARTIIASLQKEPEIPIVPKMDSSIQEPGSIPEEPKKRTRKKGGKESKKDDDIPTSE